MESFSAMPASSRCPSGGTAASTGKTGVSILSKQRSIPPSGGRFPNVELVATLRDWNARVRGNRAVGTVTASIQQCGGRGGSWCVRKNQKTKKHVGCF